MCHFMSFRCINRWIATFCGLVTLLLGQGELSALSLTEGPSVTFANGSATVTWKTDVICGSRVNYGMKAELLDQRASGFLGQSHSVTLEGLKAGTTYYFSVSSAREQLAKSSFTLGKSGTLATTSTSNSSSRTSISGPTSTSSSGSPPSVAKAKPLPQLSTSAVLPAAPPTRQTWGYLGSLQDHFDRHGRDFQAKSPDDYAAQAWQFLQRAKRDGLPMKLDTDGTIRVWDGTTGAFAAYNRDGTAKTYFKPGNSSYWQRQPGRSIKPSEISQR
jgi:hypothetical protein